MFRLNFTKGIHQGLSIVASEMNLNHTGSYKDLVQKEDAAHQKRLQQEMNAVCQRLAKGKELQERLLSLIEDFNCERHFGKGTDHSEASKESLTKAYNVLTGSKKVVGEVHGRRCSEIMSDGLLNILPLM
uniref:DUF4371 domain-containing protein n=1 Tax=Rhabditophanes sp. KR3021 TaxID=114890 RepID=A0AC35UFA6_9BILA